MNIFQIENIKREFYMDCRNSYIILNGVKDLS
jgi:hypothetical protein